jgi:serine/threonine-protein kinase RsbW
MSSSGPIGTGVSATTDPAEPLPTDVVLQVPANASSLRVVRMVTATLAADDGFDVDEVDDVRMAVDELCAAVIESAPQSPLRVRLRVIEHALTVTIDAAQDGAAPPVDELRAAVLGAVTDSYALAVAEGRIVARFAKRSGVAQGRRGTDAS